MIYYIVGINIISFIAYSLDKVKAIFHKERFSEFSLLLLSTIGGFIGALLSMIIVRHKTRKIC